MFTRNKLKRTKSQNHQNYKTEVIKGNRNRIATGKTNTREGMEKRSQGLGGPLQKKAGIYDRQC